MRFGIHVPKQADLPATARYAADIGCETIQLFSGNPMSWTTGALDARERDAFIAEIEMAGIGPVVLHTPYLINLATPDTNLQANSLRALVAAMVRAHELSVGPVIVHCGNHMGAGTDEGIERAVRMLEKVLDQTPPESTVALENGAGKGTQIGLSVDELSRLVAPFPRERVGIVLDTAHLWGFGFDLSEKSMLDGLVADLESGPGLDRVWAIHGNDSSADLGSRRDRHALWAEGRMGRRGLRNIVGCEALSHLPFIFEIPGETPEFDRKRLASMKRLDRRLNGPRN
ncbi:deoxyribonuclease IV [bacterium]|nr:deoxyribonuclease IV [bacterium]